MFMPLRVTLLFNSSVSFLKFCLDDPSPGEILMLKSLIVIVSGAICAYKFCNVYEIGCINFSSYIFKIVSPF